MPETASYRFKIMDIVDVRDTNEMHFLHLIRHRQPITRAEVVQATGLRAGTVSVVINRLLESGLIHEGEEAPSNGGRRAVYLHVNAEKAYAIGISIGVQQTVYVVSDFNGRVISQKVLLTEGDPETFLIGLAKEVTAHIRSQYTRNRPKAVGVSIPGLVDRRSGCLIISPNLGWSQVPIRAILERELGLAVYIDNDANAAALSELWYGPPEISNAHSLLFVLVVEGLGTGLIRNGELYVGTAIGQGGFGHIPMDPQGPTCSCGNVGCWEAIASNTATLLRYQRTHPEQASHLSFDDLLQLAQGGDSGARQELLTTASFIGRGIRGLAQGLAPEVVVVGGKITSVWDLVGPEIQEQVHSGYLVPGASPVIRPASVENPSLFGAIPIALRTLFQQRKLSSKVRGR